MTGAVRRAASFRLDRPVPDGRYRALVPVVAICWVLAPSAGDAHLGRGCDDTCGMTPIAAQRPAVPAVAIRRIKGLMTRASVRRLIVVGAAFLLLMVPATAGAAANPTISPASASTTVAPQPN